MSEENKVKNPMYEIKNIPICCLSIRRLVDNKIHYYSYFEDPKILMCTAFRLVWHLASIHPIEFFKGSYFAINLFHKLEKVEQHIINSLLYMRYGQDLRTKLIEHLDPMPEERINKSIPAHFYEFPSKYIWGVIHFINTLSINENIGYEVSYHHDSVLKNYFRSKESPLPIETLDELLDMSIF